MSDLQIDLTNRVIIITGAGTGLGAATAKAAAAAGATVVLLGRTPSKLEKTYDAIVEAGHPTPVLLPLNLATATWVQLEEAVNLIHAELGQIDALIHCAAHFMGFVPLAEVPPHEWLNGLQVNLTAAYTLTRLCLPHLLARPHSRVVFVLENHTGHAFDGIYGISKAAVAAMAASWQAEYSHQEALKICGFTPPPMRTVLRKKGYPGDDFAALPHPDSVAGLLLEQLL
jgi:NAD(P)-dependent dehydrogenase (short-subunit alcohol dehydrogenase family)